MRPATHNKVWHGNAPYNPAMMEKYLTIFRTVDNYVFVGDDGKTPAMRLGFTKAPLEYEDILWPGQRVPRPKAVRRRVVSWTSVAPLPASNSQRPTNNGRSRPSYGSTSPKVRNFQLSKVRNFRLKLTPGTSQVDGADGVLRPTGVNLHPESFRLSVLQIRLMWSDKASGRLYENGMERHIGRCVKCCVTGCREMERESAGGAARLAVGG